MTTFCILHTACLLMPSTPTNSTSNPSTSPISLLQLLSFSVHPIFSLGLSTIPFSLVAIFCFTVSQNTRLISIASTIIIAPILYYHASLQVTKEAQNHIKESILNRALKHTSGLMRVIAHLLVSDQSYTGF